MARHLFGLSSADYAMQKVGTELELVPGAEGTVWDAFTGGTQITDLTDLNDSPITTVTADVNARVGFYGPDGVSSLYVDFGFDGGRTLLQATDLGASLDQLQIYVDSLVSGGGEAPATRYVASYEAPDAEKLNAHYTCDGVDDDVEIQAAIEAVKTLGGGTVLLSTGRFYTSNQIIVQGTDDVDDELDLMIRGQGVGNTLVELVDPDDSAGSAFHLTGVIRAHLSEFKVAVSGANHGISSATLGGPNSGMRSFWLSSFRNLQIDGPWDGTHTGWGMHLGSPFRSIFENIDIGGVGNGVRMYSEDSSFNPGDCTVTRVFVDSMGDNMIAYQVDSTTNDGVMNQIEFSMCEAIASGTGCTGIHITGTGGWGTAHTHWRGINLEEFDKLIDVEYGSSNTFRLNHVNLRGGATGLTAYTFGANSFNNAVLSTGLLYATDSCVLFDDDNTMEPTSPNRVLDTRVYTVDSGVTVSATANSSATTVWERILAAGDGTVTTSGSSTDEPVITPVDHGLIAWTQDPANLRSASNSSTSGTVYLGKVKITKRSTVTNILIGIESAGATLTAGQSLVGLYSSAGTRLAQSADQSGNWTSTGLKTIALTAPVTVQPGYYYVAILSVGGTPPQFSMGAGGALNVNAGLTTGTARFLTGPTAQTSLPASITLSSQTQTTGARWAALS